MFFRVDFSRFEAIQQNMSTNASQNMPENSDNLRYLKSQSCDITQKVEAPIRFRIIQCMVAYRCYIIIVSIFFVRCDG